MHEVIEEGNRLFSDGETMDLTSVEDQLDF